MIAFVLHVKISGLITDDSLLYSGFLRQTGSEPNNSDTTNSLNCNHFNHSQNLVNKGEIQSDFNSSEPFPSGRQLHRSRGPIPPRLPSVDTTFVPKGPRSPLSDTSGSQESSPKPPLSPAHKVYHELDFSRHPLSSLNDRKTVYRKVSNRLLDSSSSDEEDEEENEEARRYNTNSRASSESTPSPRTPNSYKILSGIANNQATAFRFPPISPIPSRSSFCGSNERLSSRATTGTERQSSDEFSTTMSSFYSRSTSTETNDEYSTTSVTGNSLSAASIGARNRRVSPLRKQSAIAEEFLANDFKSLASQDNSSDSLNRFCVLAGSCDPVRDSGGNDSGVDCGGQKLAARTVSNGLDRDRSSSGKTITLTGNSSNKEDENDIVDNVPDATVENTTGVIFRKVTLKKRLDRSSSSRTVSSEPINNIKVGSTGRVDSISGRDLLSNKSHSAGKVIDLNNVS